MSEIYKVDSSIRRDYATRVGVFFHRVEGSGHGSLVLCADSRQVTREMTRNELLALKAALNLILEEWP